ncbi:colicin transporter [Bifidobacterium catenulatum]|uniref:colicin transporter n=1 Tax=Bifidobacterium catenulatum TaxID=1686 RepID=UPI001FB0CF00|nr:colicin transporter [Bifidobacterium catenulatum]
MTEKEETFELSSEPMEEKTKKPHRGRAVAIIAVAVIALLAAGGIVWKTHTDRLMAEAKADCAAASERLHVATTAYNALLNGKAASMAKTDVKSVKDAKTLDVLSKAMKASTPKTVSCKADSRDAVVTATKAITANTAWYWTHGKSLNRLVNAVETSKLDKTVDDANALYKQTDGKVADDKTRASLLDAIKKTRRGRHRKSRERGQRIEDGEGEGGRGGRREGESRTGGRGSGRRRCGRTVATAGPVVHAVLYERRHEFGPLLHKRRFGGRILGFDGRLVVRWVRLVGADQRRTR